MIETTKRYAGRAAVLACGVLLAALPAMAQQPGDDNAPPPPPPAGQTGQGWQHGRHFRDMEAELDLTPQQAEVFRHAQEDARAKMTALHQDTSLTPEEVHHRMRDIRMQAAAQERAVLTDDQRVKFDAMQQHMRERMEQRRDNQDGGDAGAPPPPPAPPQPQQ